jgi:diacylglycerol kinase (ATP)
VSTVAGDAEDALVADAPTTPATPAAPRFLVCWNETAGSKAGLPTNAVGRERLVAAMAAHGLGDELFTGDSEDDVRRRVREAVRDGYHAVVAAGGDGTAELVASELVGTETALAILPLGSAMNLGRSLGLPRDLDEAAAIAGSGEVRTIEVGRSGNRLFFEQAAIGLSAALFARAKRIDKGEYGSLLEVLRVVVRFRPARVRLILDGRVVDVRPLMVAVAIGPYTGLGLTLAPHAHVADGLLDVAVYRGFGRWELVRHLWSIAAGRRRYSPKVTTYRARRVRVESRRPLPVRADDDSLGTTPAEFEVLPSALRVVVAPGASPTDVPPTDVSPAAQRL